MPKVRCNMSVSLDGYVCGPEAVESRAPDAGFFRVTAWVTELASWRVEHGMDGGRTGADDDLHKEMIANVGAHVMGRGMADGGLEPWGENPPFHTPVFVVTHRPHEPVPREGGTTFHYVTDGVHAAVEQAKAAAGDRDVAVAGGATMVQEVIAAGLLDELQLHVAPVLLNGGIRLLDGIPPKTMELELARVVSSPDVLHLTYRFKKGVGEGS